MKFSVLMSVYNKENPEYLKKSLTSVIQQTIKPNEIVIIKDGILTNELDEILNFFSENYLDVFKIISFKDNKGLGYALRVGLEQCKYDIVARMDTDDIAKNDRFEKQLKVLKNRPDICLVGSWVDEFEGSISNVVSKKKVPETNEKIKKYAKMRNPINHPTVMFRKKAVLDSGSYKHFLWNEDYYLWVRMLNRGCAMYNLQESLLYFRSGNEVYKRRGGWKYAIQDIRLQTKFLKLGFISFWGYIRNIIIRCSVRLIPNNLRKIVYDMMRTKRQN